MEEALPPAFEYRVNRIKFGPLAKEDSKELIRRTIKALDIEVFDGIENELYYLADGNPHFMHSILSFNLAYYEKYEDKDFTKPEGLLKAYEFECGSQGGRIYEFWYWYLVRNWQAYPTFIKFGEDIYKILEFLVNRVKDRVHISELQDFMGKEDKYLIPILMHLERIDLIEWNHISNMLVVMQEPTIITSLRGIEYAFFYPEDETEVHRDENLYKAVSDVHEMRKEILKIQEAERQLAMQMFSTQKHVAAVQDTVATVQKNVSSVQSNVATVQETVSTVQGNVATVQADVTTVKGDVATVQQSVSTVQNDVSTVQEELAGIEKKVESLSGMVYYEKGMDSEESMRELVAQKKGLFVHYPMVGYLRSQRIRDPMNKRGYELDCIADLDPQQLPLKEIPVVKLDYSAKAAPSGVRMELFQSPGISRPDSQYRGVLVVEEKDQKKKSTLAQVRHFIQSLAALQRLYGLTHVYAVFHAYAGFEEKAEQELTQHNIIVAKYPNEVEAKA